MATNVALTGAGDGGGAVPFVGAYDSIVNLVHIYEPARCTLSAYSGGNLLRLRRASDDAEADFSHVSASDPELNVAAIAAWAGGASYIVSVYDQKTGDTITQGTAANQPLFVANAQNGHAGATFNGTTHHWLGQFTIGGALSQPYTYYAVAQLDATVVDNGLNHYLVGGEVSANRCVLSAVASETPDAWGIYATLTLAGTASDSDWNIWSVLFNGATSRFWHNGVAECVAGNAGANNPTGISIGARDDGLNQWKGPWVSTVICDPSHSDAQRVAMQTAMNDYWGVY